MRTCWPGGEVPGERDTILGGDDPITPGVPGDVDPADIGDEASDVTVDELDVFGDVIGMGGIEVIIAGRKLCL